MTQKLSKTKVKLFNRINRIPRLAANYVLLSGAEFISKILAAIAFAFLARVLGPQSYGHLEFVLAVILVFTLIVDSGLNSYGAREIAKDNNSAPSLIVHITLSRLILAFVAFILLSVITALINQPDEVKRLLFIYSITLFFVPGLIQWVFQGRDLMHYIALSSLIRWSIFATCVFIFIHNPSQLWFVPIIEGFAILCVVLFLGMVLFKTYGRYRYRLNITHAFSIYRKALPIGASELVWAVKVYFATFTLAFVVAGSELGWFSAAHRIVISLHAFVWLYFYNLLPSIARVSQKSPDELHKLMGVSIQVTAWSVIFLGIFGTAFAEPVIRLLYGSQYREATSAFQILIWLIPLAMMSGHYRYVLIGYDKQQLEFLSAVFGAVVNIVLNLWLIPSYGLIGAAYSLVLSEAIIWIFAYYFVRRTITHLFFLNHIQKPIMAGIILVILLYFLKPINMWVAASLSSIAYLLFLFLTQPNLLYDFLTKYVRDPST